MILREWRQIVVSIFQLEPVRKQSYFSVKGMLVFSLFIAACCVSTNHCLAQKRDIPSNHPYVPVLKLAYAGLEALEQVKDYEAVLTKRELIGKRLTTQQVKIKIRQQPFSVYLKFREPFAGREVLFVQGQNSNSILAHEGSGLAAIIGTVSLPVNSREAMKGNKYPITMIGLENMLDTLIKQWELETQFGECEVKYYPNATLGNVKCRVVETSHPTPRKQFLYKRTRLYLDKETNLPIRSECYGFPARVGDEAPLIEQYTYENLRINEELTDFDFDRKNPNYRF
ncbi:MAG: DUF1571 domain-containing protein [Planctomycetaceae bacterium]|nr:DUF1571 domain-containing protein [Planctomycetaceae bacterium]